MIGGSPQSTPYSTNNASQVSTEQEQQAQQNQAFWNQIYSQFNPQAPVQNTPSSGPGFQQAGANTKGFEQSLQGAAGATGSTDTGALRTGIDNTANQLTRSTDLNSYLSDMNKNSEESNKYGVAGFGRMNNIFDTQNKLNQLPQERLLSGAETEDKENQAWKDYLNSQNPVGNLIGGSVGSLFGKVAGQKLFGQQQNPASSSLNGIYNQEDNLVLPE